MYQETLLAIAARFTHNGQAATFFAVTEFTMVANSGPCIVIQSNIKKLQHALETMVKVSFTHHNISLLMFTIPIFSNFYISVNYLFKKINTFTRSRL